MTGERDEGVVIGLPDRLRSALKEPMGEVFTDARTLLEAAGNDSGRGPIVSVGDVVTAHLLEAGATPDVAVVDGRSEREGIDPWVADALGQLRGERMAVRNPPATLTGELLGALAGALRGDGRAVIDVDGEEDLATLPAVLVAPAGASVVYGQPGEGMVLVNVTDESRREARELLSGFDGDVGAAFRTLSPEQGEGNGE